MLMVWYGTVSIESMIINVLEREAFSFAADMILKIRKGKGKLNRESWAGNCGIVALRHLH